MEPLRRPINDLKAKFYTLDAELANLYAQHGKKQMLKDHRLKIIELATEMKTIQAKLTLFRVRIRSVCEDIIEAL